MTEEPSYHKIKQPSLLKLMGLEVDTSWRDDVRRHSMLVSPLFSWFWTVLCFAAGYSARYLVEVLL